MRRALGHRHGEPPDRDRSPSYPALIATIVFVIASANLIAHYGHGRAIFLVIPTTALVAGNALLWTEVARPGRHPPLSCAADPWAGVGRGWYSSSPSPWPSHPARVLPDGAGVSAKPHCCGIRGDPAANGAASRSRCSAASCRHSCGPGRCRSHLRWARCCSGCGTSRRHCTWSRVTRVCATSSAAEMPVRSRASRWSWQRRPQVDLRLVAQCPTA